MTMTAVRGQRHEREKPLVSAGGFACLAKRPVFLCVRRHDSREQPAVVLLWPAGIMTPYPLECLEHVHRDSRKAG